MKKYIITLILFSLIGFGIYTKIYIPKHTFKTIQTQNGNMKIVVNGVGEVSAKETYKIGSIYGGKVLNLTINEGEFIKKGTLIAIVDSVDLKDKIKELKATIQKLFSDIKSLSIDKQSAIVSYEYQDKILKKNKKLYKKGAISELDFAKFKTNAKTAKLKIDTIEAKILSLKSQQKQLQANIDGLNERLKRYTITAPISGYITKKYISNYAIINPNQTIIEIINPKDVWIATHIDTRISGEVKLGAKATIILRSSNKIYKGKVVNIKPINNNITYEREIDIAFNNLPIPFYLQEQANVNIKIKTLKDIVKVPLKALTVYNQKQGVWVVKDGKVSFKTIKILTYGKKGIATKDIEPNATLVIPNPKKKALSDGMKIRVQK